MSLGLVSWVGGRVVGQRLKLQESFWGDWCWEAQMRKDGVTIKGRNALAIIPLKT